MATITEADALLLGEATSIRARSAGVGLLGLGGLRAAMDDVLRRTRPETVAPSVKAEVGRIAEELRRGFLAELTSG